MSPLVVCVLDEYASTGGLLKCHAGSEVSFALQVKYSFAGHLGEVSFRQQHESEQDLGIRCRHVSMQALENESTAQMPLKNCHLAMRTPEIRIIIRPNESGGG